MSGVDEHRNFAKNNEENQIALYQKINSTEEFLLSGESRTSKVSLYHCIFTLMLHILIGRESINERICTSFYFQRYDCYFNGLINF